MTNSEIYEYVQYCVAIGRVVSYIGRIAVEEYTNVYSFDWSNFDVPQKLRMKKQVPTPM